MLEYYLLLRSVLKSKPHLRRCRKRCWHCRIFFLTDPRNGRRTKLGCPFGCQKSHRRRESTRRSVAYYRTPEGRKKKRDLNQRRRSPPGPAPRKLEETLPDAGHPMVAHLQVAVGLIEGRPFSQEQILCLVEKVLRQPRMARVRRIDQIIDHLNRHPP